ncbi:MAG: TRAP transporter substrate-binding protein [Clostridiales Family XIII bacterium]|nr:TRAP transporter substrate-binding protein [Clostridiales Family XIII bacterium]
MKRKSVSLLLAAVLILTMVFAAGCSRGGSSDADAGSGDAAAGGEQVTIRVAHEVAETHPSHIALLDIFKKNVEEQSGGNITVEIYANGQLGTMTENLEAMKIGDLEMVWGSDAPVAVTVPEWSLVGLPFLFTSVDAAHDAFDGDFGAKLDELLDAAGIVNLGWGDVGFRNITNSKQTIKTPEDLAGLKIRTMSNALHKEYFTDLGAVPQEMQFSELLTALQQKQVDGQENPTAMIWNNGIYEVQTYMTVSEHVWSAAPVLIAKPFLEGLSSEYQEIIKNAAADAVAFQREELTKQNQDLLKNIEDAGLEVTVLTEAEKAPFQKIAQDGVWKTAAATYGQELIDLAASYNK